jgi:hypothetical protein
VRSARKLRADVRAARGNDRLTGGTGADRFSAGCGSDVNADYTPRQDDITDGS